MSVLNSLIERSPVKARGSYTMFVKLSPRRGIKLFQSAIARDKAMEAQSKAWDIHLGPKVYGKVDNVEFNSIPMYGYYTEVVKVLNRGRFYRLRLSIQNRISTKVYNEIRHITPHLVDVGVDTSDLHMFNIGWKDGNMVMIDFGCNDYEGKGLDEKNYGPVG